MTEEEFVRKYHLEKNQTGQVKKNFRELQEFALRLQGHWSNDDPLCTMVNKVQRRSTNVSRGRIASISEALEQAVAEADRQRLRIRQLEAETEALVEESEIIRAALTPTAKKFMDGQIGLPHTEEMKKKSLPERILDEEERLEKEGKSTVKLTGSAIEDMTDALKALGLADD